MPKKRYFVKSLFRGWNEVTEQQFDRFCKTLREGMTAVPEEKKEQRIQERIRIEEVPETETEMTRLLEALDPSIHYQGTTFEGLDAFQRQLKRFNIKRR